MKKIALLVLMAVLLFSCACTNSTGRFIAKMCVSNQTSTSFSMRYDSLDGEKTYTIKANEGDVMSIKFETTSGSLSCVIRVKGGEVLYQNDSVQTSELNITLPVSGKYEIALKANEHKGAFYFDWKQ